MTLKNLLDFVSMLFMCKESYGDPKIKARLVWRDDEGTVTRIELAEFGYCSGLRNELNVEMNTASTRELRDEDRRLVVGTVASTQDQF